MDTSSSSPSRWKYDAFLCYEGEDTQNFVDHLHSYLHQRGIYALKDDDGKFARGRSCLQHQMAIEESRFAIVVFSRNFAFSSRCLDELAMILGCTSTKGQTVLPIFYDVDPSDVRKQRGSFGEAFAKHQKVEIQKLQMWKAALLEAANISGWALQNNGNGHDLKIISEIVEEIGRMLRRVHVAEHQVGLDSRAKELLTLLDGKSDGVCMVGICGIGGIGKTTLAKVVFNEISHQFERTCFLANVRELTEQCGITRLQEEILCEIALEKNIKISNMHRGTNLIKQRLCRMRVLVVLDDVNQLKQLETLAGKHDWFGPGSRIIITSRDEHFLRVHRVDHIYNMKILEEDEALQLFSWHAFGRVHPTENYFEIAKSITSYAEGLPLALKVLGSSLYGKNSIEEWESTMSKLRKNPNNEIQDVLRVGFDALDDTEKDIFLDIACFFKGEEKDHVIDLLTSNGLYPCIGITVLAHKSLITLLGDRLWMHDLIQEMGREIVYQESPEEPGKRSRLWLEEDIHKVLAENTVTDKIEGMILNVPNPKDIHVRTDAFEKMQKLRLLKLQNVHLYGHLTHLSNELSYLNWHGYPLNSMPSNFHAQKLVELDFCYSHIKQFWDGVKIMGNLKLLNLSSSPYLEKTPSLTETPYLEKLHLDNCKSLVEVDSTIGVHERLVELTLLNCENLTSFPKNIYLKSLRNFVLSGCSKLEKFPEIIGDMDCLVDLLLGQTGIKDLPSSIEHLIGLRTLNLTSCEKLTSIPSSIFKLRSLKRLVLTGCSNLQSLPEIPEKMESLTVLTLDGTSIRQLPSSIVYLGNLEVLSLGRYDREEYSNSSSSSISGLGSLLGLSKLKELVLSDGKLLDGSVPRDLGFYLSSLVLLDLSRNDIVCLPESIVELGKLDSLQLEYCTRLRALPSLPSSIRLLDAHGCSSLETFTIPSSSKGCPDDRLFLLTNGNELLGNNLSHMPSKNQLQGLGQIAFPGSDIPDWIAHRSDGSSVSLWVDPHKCSKLKGIILCAVWGWEDGENASPGKIVCDLKVNDYEQSYEMAVSSAGKSEERQLGPDHIFLTQITRGRYEISRTEPQQQHMVDRPEPGSIWLGPRAGPVKNLTYLGSRPSSGTSLHRRSLFEASFRCSSDLPNKVKKCGIHLVFESENSPDFLELK